MAQESEVEGGLDRPQQPVVVIVGGVPAGRDLRPDDDGGDVAAGGQTAAAAGLSTSAGAFVPGDDQAGVVLPGRGAGQLLVQGPQPIVPSPDQRAVVPALSRPVHVVVEAGGDQHEPG